MKYINPNNITSAEIVAPNQKYHEWEKETYGWRLIILFNNSPSIFIEQDSREDCQRKAEVLNLVLV